MLDRGQHVQFEGQICKHYTECIYFGRNPVFANDVPDEDQRLANAYCMILEMHKEKLHEVERLLQAHLKMAARLNWMTYTQNTRMLMNVIIQIQSSPKLLYGWPLCHSSFVPIELP